MGLVSKNNPVLRKVAEEVSEADNLTYLSEKLWDYYNSKNGRILGISLPQLGYSKRMCLVKLPKIGTIVMINPVVKFKLGAKGSQEGCESLGGKAKQYAVWRPWLIRVTYMQLDKTHISLWCGYKKARIIMHEIDHLNGVCIDTKGVRV